MADNSKITYRCVGCMIAFDTPDKVHKHMAKCPALKKWLKQQEKEKGNG